eukprot:COSAG02_NODE_17432_length_1004_cov_1.029834_1_plen_93_part_00
MLHLISEAESQQHRQRGEGQLAALRATVAVASHEKRNRAAGVPYPQPRFQRSEHLYRHLQAPEASPQPLRRGRPSAVPLPGPRGPTGGAPDA